MVSMIQWQNWGDKMYLSRIELDISNRNTMKALQSLSKFHGAVENSFSGERKRKLWRIDDLRGKKYILILSEDKPNLHSFAEQYGYEGGYITKDYSSLLDRISKGSKWQFRITANPTVFARKTPGGKLRNMPHITTEYQKKWLMDRAEKNGFSLDSDSFQTVKNKWYKFYKKDGEKSPLVRLLSVTFEGVLTVTDEDKFKETLCNGIGREKAYGQGLLTVIRL